MQNYYYEVCYFLYRHYLMLIKNQQKPMIYANCYYITGELYAAGNSVFTIETQYFIYALTVV